MSSNIDLTKPRVIYGLTGGPLHFGHIQSYEYLRSQGNEVLVSPAIGHEFKPEAIATYMQRREMCRQIFGDAMVPLEEYVLGFPNGTNDLDAIRAALINKGSSVMAIDMLRMADQMPARQFMVNLARTDWRTGDTVKNNFFDLAKEPNIKFAVGPDVDVEKWTGVELIRAEFGKDPFVSLPEIPNIRSTLIRTNILTGQPWEHMVPKCVADLIKAERMYGYTPA